MKKLSFTFILLFFSIYLFSQNDKRIKKEESKETSVKTGKNSCLEFDAIDCCKNIDIPTFLKEGSRLSIKFKNVNPFAAKLAISVKADTIHLTGSDVFNLDFANRPKDSPEDIESDLENLLDEKNSMLSEITEDRDSLIGIKAKSKDIKKLEEEIEKLKKNYK